MVADLEIALRRLGDDSFEGELCFRMPGSDSEVRIASTGVPLRFDIPSLEALELDTDAYGKALTTALLADEGLATGFAQARTSAQTQGLPLRVRLFIHPGAAQLHGLRWEVLRDPSGDAPLFTGEQVMFSRYLSSSDWVRVQL